MTPLRKGVGSGYLIEIVCALAIFLAIARMAYLVHELRYIPQPFFYEPSDTFADWFNPAHWSRTRGAYDTWRALYPPISFVFLRFLGIDRCYDPNGFDFSAGLAARSCDWLGISAIFAIFFLNIVLVYASLRKIDPSRAPMRTVAVAIGFPALNGLERGNLVLITFTCFILAFGPLLRSFHARSFFAACVVNFKVYLIAAIAPLVLRREWRRVEQYTILVIVVYLTTYALVGGGSVFELFDNIKAFSELKPQNPLDISLAGSYRLAIEMLRGDEFPSTLLMGSQLRDGILYFIQAAIVLGQMIIVSGLLAAAFKPGIVPPYRLVCLGVILAEISSEAGAYSIVYHAFLVMMEPWRGFGRKFAIVLTYLIAIPVEIPIDRYFSVQRFSYITSEVVSVEYFLGAVSLIRPLCTILVGCALSLVTINAVLSRFREERIFARIES